jgi:hypothetical protein
MTAQEAYAVPLHLDELISEIERYLAAVAVFRSEGCEPRWSAEEGLPAEALPDLLSPWPERVHA